MSAFLTQFQPEIVVILRALFILPFTLAVTLLLLGKKTLAHLPAFDFVVTLALGAIVGASIVLPAAIRLWQTIGAILSVATLAWVSRWARLRWPRYSRLVAFEPTVVIYKGDIVAKSLRRVGYTIDDLFYQMRLKGYYEPTTIELGLVEPNGSLSLLPRADALPPTRKELKVTTERWRTPLPLVADGRYVDENLKAAGLSRRQVEDELKRLGLAGGVKAIFLAYYDSAGRFRAAPYQPVPGTPAAAPPKIIH